MSENLIRVSVSTTIFYVTCLEYHILWSIWYRLLCSIVAIKKRETVLVLITMEYSVKSLLCCQLSYVLKSKIVKLKFISFSVNTWYIWAIELRGCYILCRRIVHELNICETKFLSITWRTQFSYLVPCNNSPRIQGRENFSLS